MHYPSAERDAVAQVVELEAHVSAVEERLAQLQTALRERDAPSIELHADQLHQALARAVHCVMQAARNGGVPESMRLRLAHAGAQVARQREVLSRATAALDRAIDVLLPGQAGAHKVYNASGQTESILPRGSLNA